MISEPIEIYRQGKFDYEGHIAMFLHTSASYLEVSDDEHGLSHEASTSPNEEV